MEALSLLTAFPPPSSTQKKHEHRSNISIKHTSEERWRCCPQLLPMRNNSFIYIKIPIAQCKYGACSANAASSFPRLVTSAACNRCLHTSDALRRALNLADHHIRIYPPPLHRNGITLSSHRLFMSLLNLTKRALTRPISSSAFVAVGIAFLLLLLNKTLSDREVQQPITARKMHIQSIPMCASTLRVLPAIPLKTVRKLQLMRDGRHHWPGGHVGILSID